MNNKEANNVHVPLILQISTLEDGKVDKVGSNNNDIRAKAARNCLLRKTSEWIDKRREVVQSLLYVSLPRPSSSKQQAALAHSRIHARDRVDLLANMMTASARKRHLASDQCEPRAPLACCYQLKVPECNKV